MGVGDRVEGYQSDGSEATNPFTVAILDASSPVHCHGSSGSRPAYRHLPVAGPLCPLERPSIRLLHGVNFQKRCGSRSSHPVLQSLQTGCYEKCTKSKIGPHNPPTTRLAGDFLAPLRQVDVSTVSDTVQVWNGQFSSTPLRCFDRPTRTRFSSRRCGPGPTTSAPPPAASACIRAAGCDRWPRRWPAPRCALRSSRAPGR
jgi:hypothetical protein